MKHYAATIAAIFALLAILCPPASAQFGPLATDTIQRAGIFDTGFVEVTPTPMYDDVFNAPTVHLGVVNLARPATVRGTVFIDSAFYCENTYAAQVQEYKVYTANQVRIGALGTQVCTQVCGETNFGNGSIFALAPFDGIYGPVPTPANPYTLQGFTPTSDWHYYPTVIAFPFEFTLPAGSHEISAMALGGMGSWDNHVVTAPSHTWRFEWIRHRVRVVAAVVR